MILGIGIDIADIQRFAESVRSQAFLQKVFTTAELQAVGEYQNKAEHLAGKFAAKEALMKALGAGIWSQVWFSQIEVLNDETGKPWIQLSGEAQARFQMSKAQQIYVSISHSGGMAVAVVVLEA